MQLTGSLFASVVVGQQVLAEVVMLAAVLLAAVLLPLPRQASCSSLCSSLVPWITNTQLKTD